MSRQIRINGQIIADKADGAKPHLVIEVDPELRMALPRTRVRKTVRESDLEWYKSAAAAAGKDAESHYQLARVCKGKGLLAQSDYHFRRVIEIDPDHSKARLALDYARDGSKWVPLDQLQRSRGLILADGTWQIPEVYARTQAREKAKKQASLLKREFNKRRGLIIGGGKRASESLEWIEQVADPLAAGAFAEGLSSSRGKTKYPRSLRKLYVRKLGEFRTPESVGALIETGLADPDTEIRTLALKELQDFGARTAVLTYLQLLRGKSRSPAQVTAALRALMYFPDPELWPHYVDALQTEHETITPAGPGMNVGQSSNGGIGLGMGGNKPTVRTSTERHPEALELLKEIAPGVDLRYDETAWRDYFASQLLGSVGDLRRDP
ncbi:MAG: HEAT repeat domain-containing protein [Planctomycetota bacterium]